MYLSKSTVCSGVVVLKKEKEKSNKVQYLSKCYFTPLESGGDVIQSAVSKENRSVQSESLNSSHLGPNSSRRDLKAPSRSHYLKNTAMAPRCMTVSKIRATPEKRP